MQHHTLIAHQFDQAIRQATLSVRFGFGAIVCFCIFGTLASLPAFKDSTWIYYAFHYLPYALIANPIANVAMRLDVKKQCFKHIFERLVDRSLWAVMPILIRLSIV